MVRTKRQVNREQIERKWMKMYQDMQNGRSYDWIAAEYKYASAASVRSIFHLRVLPMIKEKEGLK